MRAAIVCALAAATLAGCLNQFEEPVRPHHVRIVSLELSPERVLSQEVVLNVTSVLDNRGGGASDAIRLEAQAFSEDTGFLVAENGTSVGVFPGDTTRPVPVLLRVPREGSVRIEATLFEAGLARERASVSARNLARLEPEVLDTGLRISDVDFLVRDVAPGGGNRTGARATIQADLYVTNEGDAPSEDLRVQVKARESATRLVADVAWVGTGAVAPGATVVRSANLSVPEGYNFVFEILTWRGEVIVARSEGVVQLAPTYVKPADQEVVTQNPDVRDFLVATPSLGGAGWSSGGSMGGRGPDAAPTPTPQVPGFGAAALVLAALAALLVLRRRAP